MLNHLFMKIVTHTFGYEICSMANIYGFKIFDESILLGFNWTLHIHTPSPSGQQPWRLPEWTSKKLSELLWVSLNSMYGLKIPAGEKINPKNMISATTPDTLICKSPNPSMGVSISTLKHLAEIWDLCYAYQRLINDQLV